MVTLLLKLLFAGLLLGGICWLALQFLFLPGPSLIWKIVELAVTIAAGAAAFFGTAFLLRVSEVRDVVELVRRRLS